MGAAGEVGTRLQGIFESRVDRRQKTLTIYRCRSKLSQQLSDDSITTRWTTNEDDDCGMDRMLMMIGLLRKPKQAPDR